MLNIVEIIEAIASENPEGFTYCLKTNQLIASGVVVAYNETQNAFGTKGLKMCINHAINHDGYIGGWLNQDGVLQYDSCKVFNEKSIKPAVKWGKIQKQIAIFDLDSFNEIVL